MTRFMTGSCENKGFIFCIILCTLLDDRSVYKPRVDAGLYRLSPLILLRGMVICVGFWEGNKLHCA